MNKLKMLVLTALAAVTVGTGALAAAPSASAMPINTCAKLYQKYEMYSNVLELLEAAGYGGTQAAHDAEVKADTYLEAYYDTCY
jgi:hypothetical protein